MTMGDLIAKPFQVKGQIVTARQIAEAIDLLAGLPRTFIAMDLVPAILPGAHFHDRQEALNRLFQRWRKLDLVYFDKGRWSLTHEQKSWGILQAAALRARLMEGEGEK